MAKFNVECARVIAWEVKESGMAMTVERAAIPTIDPRPNSRINKIPFTGSPTIAVVNTIKAAEPASPCIRPTSKVRAQPGFG